MFFLTFNSLLALFCFGRCVKFNLDAIIDMPFLLNEGKQQLDVITANSRAPQYGACWSDAVFNLKFGCRYLTEELQSDLALKLTDCFLQMSGQGAISCLATRKACLQSLSDRKFNAYTEFYTHTQNICYFLQSKLWHQESEKTIDRLSSTSQKVSMQLADAQRGQEALLQQQFKSLNLQLNMAQNMEKSKEKINGMMEEIRLTALEQQIALGSLFSQLSMLQTWAIGELSWLDSVFFYSSAAILSCIFTSVSRTQRARLPLLLTFTLNYGLERYCCSFFNNESKSVIDTSNSLQSWVWFLRKIATSASVFIWSYIALTYCDYNIINYKMLVQIKQQNLELRDFLKRHGARDMVDCGDEELDNLNAIAVVPVDTKLVDSWLDTSVENQLPQVFTTALTKHSLPNGRRKSPSDCTTGTSVQTIDSDSPRYSPTLRRSARLKKYASPC